MSYPVLLLLSFCLLVTTEGYPVGLVQYPWRTRLSDTCWTNVSCNRALVVSHGGDWTLFYPYDSLPAFERAYKEGADSIKGDFRVSKDNVGVVMHSSPVEIWESYDCWGKKVEEMTVEECTSCHMEVTQYKFISVPEFLKWGDEKAIVMLCVKRAEDIPRAIETLIENNAQDRAFLEIKVGDLHMIKNVSGWDKVYYLAEGGNAADIDTILSPNLSWLLPRIFTFEYDPTYEKWGINITESIDRLHKHGVKTLTATSKLYPSVKSQEDLYLAGFDIVYTYDTKNAIIARTNIDKQRGISP